jgi:hypothetical protein
VPILYTGVPDSRLDIVFIADLIDYTGPDDPQFLADVQTAIRDAYYAADTTIRNGGRTFLFNQDAMNFWIALDTGEACDFFVAGSTCRDHVLPNKWDTTYSFADSGALVHTRNLRDFAKMDRRAFSVGTNTLDNYLHELGHSPFGLADEYCCDSYYFQPEPYPNIYSNQTDCLNDPLAAGVVDACQLAITSNWPHHDLIKYGITTKWFRVESAANRPNDLMQDSGDHTANPADERQINWYFNECRGGAC